MLFIHMYDLACFLGYCHNLRLGLIVRAYGSGGPMLHMRDLTIGTLTESREFSPFCVWSLQLVLAYYMVRRT